MKGPSLFSKYIKDIRSYNTKNSRRKSKQFRLEMKGPLVFYKKIAALALVHLKPGGRVYFEINEAFGGAISHLLAKAGLGAIRLQQDLRGKDRWITAVASP